MFKEGFLPPRKFLEREKLSSEAKEFLENFDEHVIFEDDDLLALNKPPGIVSHSHLPRHKLGIVELAQKARGPDIYLLNRLDRDTSGLFLLAKNKEAQADINKQFKNREVEKSYVALVDGDFENKLAGIIAPIARRGTHRGIRRVGISERARSAATAFQEIAEYEDSEHNKHSLLSIRIFTGRTHQIRAHLAFLDYPVTGDHLYNSDKRDFSRQLLHSFKLTFKHPQTGREMTLKAPLPKDFREFISGMEVVKKEKEGFEDIVPDDAV